MAGRLTPPLMMLVLKGLRLIREDGSWSRAEEESDVSIFNCASLAPALTMGTRGLRRAIEAGLVTNALEAPRIAITNTAASARIDGDATADATAGDRDPIFKLARHSRVCEPTIQHRYALGPPERLKCLKCRWRPHSKEVKWCL